MAKKKITDPNALDAYYAAMQSAKQASGLSLADATEVTARQRAEDSSNPEFTIPGETTESSPE